MRRYGSLGPNLRHSTLVPRLLLPVLGSPSRCPLRADGRAELTAGSVPSPPHLSLAAIHRRGWGSLYAALSLGGMSEGGLRDSLSRHTLEDGGSGDPPIYAVDVSVWPRCDAETSPERGYYYHPSRHSAGQPIVAGWAYQLVAQLGFERDSWVAPVDARRVKPAEDANEVATGQVRALVRRLPESEAVPIFVFDAGYDPVKLQRSSEGCPARILVCGCTPTGSSTPTPSLLPRGRSDARAATARSST